MKKILQTLAEAANYILKNEPLHADFQRLANIIRTDFRDINTKKMFAQRVLDTERNNPRFNAKLFLKACGLETEITRTVKTKAQHKTVDGWTLEDILRREG